MSITITSTSAPEYGMATFSIPNAHFESRCEMDLRTALIKQALVAESVGIDVFGVNETYAYGVIGEDPFDLLTEIAEKTTNLRLCTSICDIETRELEDRHAAFHRVLDVTNDRVEVVLDRDCFAAGSHSEDNPTFNRNLAEWIRLIQHCGTNVTWIEVSGSSDAILQAASHRIPMMLQVNQGNPLEQKTFTDMYHMANSRFGAGNMPLGFLAPGFVGPTDEEAQECAFLAWRALFGPSFPESEHAYRFRNEVEHGALFVGSPDTVATKIAKTVEHLGLNRFFLRYNCGFLTHEAATECIRLYGEEVIPRLRNN